MSDYIDRQEAISAIQKEYADTDEGTDKCAIWKNVGLTCALHLIQDLPSAERRGRWTTERTMEHDGEWYCSVCGYEPTVYEASNFCPNCGARMEASE